MRKVFLATLEEFQDSDSENQLLFKLLRRYVAKMNADDLHTIFDTILTLGQRLTEQESQDTEHDDTGLIPARDN